MKPKKIWSNIAVIDLERTTKFYTTLGFKHNGADKDLTSFLFGQDNYIIHFFRKDKLRDFLKSEITNSHSSNEIIFTLSADSKSEVDDWAKEVETAGGKIVSKPEEFGEGYYGFTFADPDGHKFNVFYM